MQPIILHVGCGNAPLPAWAPQGDEIRFDIDPNCNPDILGSILDIPLPDNCVDYVVSSHVLEHVYPHELAVALKEFLRVLKPGGGSINFVPDLEDVKPTEDVVMDAPCGPITGLDMYYGYRPLLSIMPYMAHHNGFVKETFDAALAQAGFDRVKAVRCANLQLLGVGVK